MSTSWRSPFPILPAPHTTPVSTNSKSLRRPIHNPYDKFTKPEFDEWISGITGALRRALGEETQEDTVLHEHQSQDVNAADEDTFPDQSFEDSFADIQSRRAKGKAKDPREGPGLGAQQNPIELLSDSESGSESEEEYDEYSDREVEGFGADEEREVDDDQDQAGHWTANDRHCLVNPQVEEDEVEEISSREESPDIIEIGSDEEEDTRASVHEAGYSGGQCARSPQLPPDEVEDELGPNSAILDEQKGQLDAEVEDFPLSTTQRQPPLPLELPDPWLGPRTYAEDFYAGGDFSAQDQLNDVSPSSLTPVHDAHVDTLFPNVVQDGNSPSRVSKTEPAVVNVDVTDDALPDSSPPPSSPAEVRSSRSHVDDYQLSNVRGTHEENEEPENILDHLYRDADSMSQDEQQMIFASSFDGFHSGSMSPQAYSKPTEHLDWNWPPAFPRGKFASRAGHLETSSPRAGVDEAQDDVIDVDAEQNEEEDRSEEAPEGPIPLGTSDLGYDNEIDQGGQDEQSDGRNELGMEVVQEDDIQAPEADQFPLTLETPLNADERAAVESFFDLLDCGALPSANVTEQVETTLADLGGMVADEFLGGDVTSPQGIEEAGDITVPTEALEPWDRELQSQHPDAMVESSAVIEPTPATEIQNDVENITLENVEHFPLPSAAPTSPLGDSLVDQLELDKPNDEPIFIVVEMEAIAPISRGVSEGVETISFAGEVSDLDGEYIVEEPPTAGASVEPEAEVAGPVDVLVETVPVTPSAELSSSDNHNVSTFPMPIFCDPSVSDPISSGTKHPQQTPPRLVKLPGTPHIIISPHSTPGQPTPVSVSVSTSMLHTFSRRVSPSEGSSGPSGLFTPREGEPNSVDTGDGTPSPSRADLPLPSSDDVVASVASALAEESRAEIDTTIIGVSDNVVTEPSPAGTSSVNPEDGKSELVEAMQLGVSRPSFADDDAENETDQPPTKPDTGNRSVAEDTTVASLEPEEVQQAVGISPPTAVDQMLPSDDDHPEAALASAEAAPADVLGPVDSPLLSLLSEQEPLPSLASEGQVPPEPVREPGQDDSQEDVVSKNGLEHLTNVSDTPNESSDVREPEKSGDAEDQESQRKPSKRKRTPPVQTSSRLTRSMSGRVSAGRNKTQGDHKAEQSVSARSRKRKIPNVKYSGSDHGSASSGASTAAKILQVTDGSRASSIVSSAPSDSSSIRHSSIPPPLFHAHGAMHHRHRPPLLPSVPVQIHDAKMTSLGPSHNAEGQKDFSSISAATRTTSSNIQRPAASTSSPVTRSNCRFHKVSLPKEEGGPRVCFVVPGCSLGDKELMDEEEIEDHGPATYEDYPRLVGNIEALDFNPYLVGILRQLVGVDLIRENEVFYLLQPGEEAQYKKKGRRSTAGSKLAASMSQSAINSPQVSVASRRSPFTSISRPPVSTAGSISTSFGSSLSEAQLYKYTSSSLFSASGDELSDEEGSPSKLKRRRKESVSDKETRVDVEGDNVPQDPQLKAPQLSTPTLKRRRSKRQGADSATYKPHPEDVEGSDSGADGLGKDRRKTKKGRGPKRPRVSDGGQDSQVKRQKQVPTE